jgi:hypothetical protein
LERRSVVVLVGGAAAFPLVCKSLEVLGGGCEVKLIARASEASQTHAFEAMAQRPGDG